MIQNGFLFVATGEIHVRAANMAARSIRDQIANAEIDLFSDSLEFVEKDQFDKVEIVENPHRRSKVDCLAKSRFDRTIYLDSDIRLNDDISEVFDLMDKFDFAIAHAHARNQPRTNSVWRTKVPLSFPQYNGGVIAYKSSNPKVIAFLKEWSESFHEAGFDKDQVTLRELLWESDLLLHTLPPEYNIRKEKYLKVWDKNEALPKVLHFKRFKNEHVPFKGLPRNMATEKKSLWKKIKSDGIGSLFSQPKTKQKVFCIGFHKTGTSSLTKALKILGYRTIHGDGNKTWAGADEGVTLTKMIDVGNFNLPTLQQFDAFSDNPYFSIWKELDQRFDAKFILTIRDPERWIDSACSYYKDRRIRHMRKWMFDDHADPNTSNEARKKWLDTYNAHNKAVLEYFKGKDNFLVMDVTKDSNWETLCQFLGLAKPTKPFPHVNKTKK
jgi:hypothetical protein